jgi:hypothetical protein
MSAIETARNSALSAGGQTAVIFPDQTFNPNFYAYRTLAVVRRTSENAAAEMVGGWIGFPDGIALFPESLGRLPRFTNVTVVVPPTQSVPGRDYPAIIFQSDGGLRPESDGSYPTTNGVAIFEGVVKNGVAVLVNPSQERFETIVLTPFTGRGRGTLAPKPGTNP